MDILVRQNYSILELRHLNAVRFYLQVASTMAEIATAEADGLRITDNRTGSSKVQH
jgi:hypothetical protein